jgi:hypothetical protein
MVVVTRSRSFRSPLLATLALFVMGPLAAMPAVASQAPEASSASTTVAVPAAVEPEALEPGPVPELSTETSTTVRNEDGTYTAKVSAGPINYEDETGQWVPISNELVEAPGGAYAVQNEANAYTVSIPENPAATPVRFEVDDAWVKMRMLGSDDVDPDVDGTEATFSDLTPAADEVSYQATDTGVKETITLQSAPTAAVSFRYGLEVSPGITPVLTAQNQIEFRDGAGTVRFVMPVPNMEDSATPEAAYTNAVAYDLVPQGGGWKLRVVPDLAWLTDPSRVYPVVIDPSVDKGDQKDCWIQADMPNANRCQNVYVYAGLAAGSTRRGLLDFGVDSLPAGATVNNATLYLFLDSNATKGNGGSTNFALFQPSQRWSIGATWNHSGIVPWNGGSSGAALSNSLNIGGGTPSGWQGWNVTGAVQGWRNGTIDNRGFMLREVNEGVSKQLGFLSGTNQLTGWRPILRIDYSDPVPPPVVDPYPDPEPDWAPMTSYGVDGAFLDDMSVVADNLGITLQQAVNRYRHQNDWSRAVANIAATYPGSYAWAKMLDSAGNSAPVIAFTGTSPPDVSAQLAGVAFPAGTQVQTVAGAKYSATQADELVSSVTSSVMQDSSQAAEVTASYDVDLQKVEVVVSEPQQTRVDTAALAEGARTDASTQYPTVPAPDVEVRRVTTSLGTDDRVKVRGGMRISTSPGANTCTSGFPVLTTNTSTTQYGIVTDSHCPDHMPYLGMYANNANLTLSDASRTLDTKYGDMQFQASYDLPVGPSFVATPTKLNAIAGPRMAQVDNQLCSYGAASNRKMCDSVDRLGVCKDVKINGTEKKVCGLVMMDRDQHIGGDSGGPWYSGQYAYGLHQGAAYVWTMSGYHQGDVFTPLMTEVNGGSNLDKMGLTLYTKPNPPY